MLQCVLCALLRYLSYIIEDIASEGCCQVHFALPCSGHDIVMRVLFQYLVAGTLYCFYTSILWSGCCNVCFVPVSFGQDAVMCVLYHYPLARMLSCVFCTSILWPGRCDVFYTSNLGP